MASDFSILLTALGGFMFALVYFSNLVSLWFGGREAEARIAALRGAFFVTYRAGLDRALRGLARWLGEPFHRTGERRLAFSALAFLACLGLAVAYLNLFITADWALNGGKGTILGVPLLYDEAMPEHRLWVLASLLALLVAPAGAARLLKLLGFSDLFALATAVIVAAAIILAVAIAKLAGSYVLFAGMIAATVAIAVAGLAAIGMALVLLVAAILIGAIAGAVTPPRAPKGRIAGFLAHFVLTTFRGGLAGGLGVAVSAAGAAAFTFSFPFAFLCAIAFAFPLAFGSIGGVGAIVAVWIALWLSAEADVRRRGWRLSPLLAAIALLPVFVQPWEASDSLPGFETVLSQTVPTPAPVLPGFGIFFITFLPALAAPLNWLALGTTRTLQGWLTRAQGGVLRLLKLRIIGQFFVLGVLLVDGALALLLAAGTVLFIAFGIALFRLAYEAAGGNPAFVLDVKAAAAALRADPYDPNYRWLYALMFGTLVPALIHAMAFAGALLRGSTGVGGLLAHWLQQVRGEGRYATAILAAFVWTALQLLPGYLLLFVLWQHGPALLTGLSTLTGQDQSLAAWGWWLLAQAEAIARAFP
ncbi:MAG: hypothetical protein HXY22_08960 [Alphaproteobacteria bacterium]|nr:hypothetical protein [Alphaproteobacteria bacterium]